MHLKSVIIKHAALLLCIIGIYAVKSNKIQQKWYPRFRTMNMAQIACVFSRNDCLIFEDLESTFVNFYIKFSRYT